MTVTGKICIFPFTLAGTTHYACTTHGNQNAQERAWCSTKVDGNGVHIGGQGLWEECGLGCPIEEVSGKNWLEIIPKASLRCANSSVYGSKWQVSYSLLKTILHFRVTS